MKFMLSMGFVTKLESRIKSQDRKFWGRVFAFEPKNKRHF